MSDRDTRDPRTFRRWQKTAPNGTPLAVIEFEASVTPTSPDAQGNTYVEIK